MYLNMRIASNTIHKFEPHSQLASTMEAFTRPMFFWVHTAHIRKGWYRKGLYAAPYSKAMPHYPQLGLSDSDNSLSPWYAFYPKDVERRDYWLALVPRRFIFEGLLEPLATLKLEQIPKGQAGCGEWRLANASQWAELEANLLYLEHNMKPGTTGFLWPIDTVMYPPPSDYGLQKSFRMQAHAKKHCRKLQALFLILMAKLTFEAFMTCRGEPTWEKRLLILQQKGHIRHEIADLIRASPIMYNSYGDHSPIERVGMRINVEGMAPAFLTELMEMQATYSMPVWIHYGDLESSVDIDIDSPALQPWLPTDEELTTCKANPCDAVNFVSVLLPPITSKTPGFPLRSNSNQQHLTSATASRHNISTRQLPGQDWQSFFVKEERYKIEEYLPSETEQQRKVRLHREKLYLEDRPDRIPTVHSSCKVFKWETLAGVQTRHFIPNVRVKDLWEIFPKSQRQYNAIRDEWDLCEWFDDEPYDPDDRDMDFLHDLEDGPAIYMNDPVTGKYFLLSEQLHKVLFSI